MNKDHSSLLAEAPSCGSPSTREPSTIYLVLGSSGEHSDRREWPVRAFRIEAAAQAEAERLLIEYRNIMATVPAEDRWDHHATLEPLLAALDEGSDVYDEPRYVACAVPLVEGGDA